MINRASYILWSTRSKTVSLPRLKEAAGDVAQLAFEAAPEVQDLLYRCKGNTTLRGRCLDCGERISVGAGQICLKHIGNPSDAGKALATIACQSLKLGLGPQASC